MLHLSFNLRALLFLLSVLLSFGVLGFVFPQNFRQTVTLSLSSIALAVLKGGTFVASFMELKSVSMSVGGELCEAPPYSCQILTFSPPSGFVKS